MQKRRSCLLYQNLNIVFTFLREKQVLNAKSLKGQLSIIYLNILRKHYARAMGHDGPRYSTIRSVANIIVHNYNVRTST